MDEIEAVVSKYDPQYVRAGLTSEGPLKSFAGEFYGDVAEIFDVLTRVKNVERNPNGFSLADAPILGLLVRMWKLLKEIVRYYREDNAEMVSLFDRVFIEAAVTAEYLLKGDASRLVDYRKCSYRHRLRMLREEEAGSPFYQTKAGRRLASSIREKMEFEGFSAADFKEQKQNRWRLEGKSFFEIFGEVHSEDLYPMSYGIMSESIHASWNDSMDFDLVQNEEGMFSTFPFFKSADPRFVGPLIKFAVPAYRMWLQRIEAYDENLEGLLEWIERLNAEIFSRFDEVFDGP